MHCGVMVTGYNQGDWERLLAEDYSRTSSSLPPASMSTMRACGSNPPQRPSASPGRWSIAGTGFLSSADE